MPLSSGLKKPISPGLWPFMLGLVSGILVFYFLYFFGAYGIQKGWSYSGHSHLFRSICFGLLTFSYLVVCEGWIKPKLNVSRLSSMIIWYLGLMLLGSQFIFLLFNFFWNWQEWSLTAYGLILKEFPLMMVLPFSFYVLLKKLADPQKGQQLSHINFQSENGKDQLRISPQCFLYARSAENYITVSYTSGGERKQHLIRKPLKVLEQELKSCPGVERSHRSYLVNSHNMQAVKQRKGKVLLEFKDVEIPVSKKYQHRFLAK